MGSVTDMTPEEFDRLEAAGEPVQVPRGHRPKAVLTRTSHLVSSTVPDVQLGGRPTATVQSRRTAVITKSASLMSPAIGEASSR